MKQTPIEWCDSTVNPTENCDGCELWNKKKRSCYAGRMTERYKGKGAFDKRPVLHPGRMRDYASLPDLRGKARPDKPWIPAHHPRLIFISDMADALSRDVPFTFLHEEIIKQVTSPEGQRHIWLWLTKQSRRLVEFSKYLQAAGVKWPVNLRPGVSITSNRVLHRITDLLQVPAADRFISYEPAWEYVDFTLWLKNHPGAITQVIAGGGSGSQEDPFNADWARKLIPICAEHNVAAFIKQMGAFCLTATDDFKCPMSQINTPPGLWRAHLESKKGGDWNEWPKQLRVRQLPTLPASMLNLTAYTAEPLRLS